MTADECYDKYAGFAYSLIDKWHRWGGMDEMRQAAMLGLLEAHAAADWAAIAGGDGRADHSADAVFMEFARGYIEIEFKRQALLSYPVSGVGRKWELRHGLPNRASLDAVEDMPAYGGDGSDADVVADLIAAASGLDTRSESIVLGSFMWGHSDDYMADFFGVTTQHVGRLRDAALVEMRDTYRD